VEGALGEDGYEEEKAMAEVKKRAAAW